MSRQLAFRCNAKVTRRISCGENNAYGHMSAFRVCDEHAELVREIFHHERRSDPDSLRRFILRDVEDGYDRTCNWYADRDEKRLAEARTTLFAKCSWCLQHQQFTYTFGDVVVCCDCALVRSTTDWFCFCEDCFLTPCRRCRTIVVTCLGPEALPLLESHSVVTVKDPCKSCENVVVVKDPRKSCGPKS